MYTYKSGGGVGGLVEGVGSLFSGLDTLSDMGSSTAQESFRIPGLKSGMLRGEGVLEWMYWI